MNCLAHRSRRFRCALQLITASIASCLLFGLGCQQPNTDDPYADAPPEQGLHGIDPQRLHYLMAKLTEMHLDRIPPDELDDPQPDPDLIRAAGMGEAMAADAAAMPAIVGEGMTATEKRTLSRQASDYRRTATELARADARQDVPRVRRALVAVTKSCIACHMALGGPHFAFDDAPQEVEDRPPVHDSRPGRHPATTPRSRRPTEQPRGRRNNRVTAPIPPDEQPPPSPPEPSHPNEPDINDEP